MSAATRLTNSRTSCSSFTESFSLFSWAETLVRLVTEAERIKTTAASTLIESRHHISVLYPYVALLEWSSLELVNSNLDTTWIKHLRDFAKVLVDAARSEEHTS